MSEPNQMEVELLAAHLCMALVVKEDRIKCLCGDPPYEDGNLCPKCQCIYLLESYDRPNVEDN